MAELNFRSFTSEMLLITCILSGCDYLDSIKGIGFKKAHRLVYENGADLKTILKKFFKNKTLVGAFDWAKKNKSNGKSQNR